MDFVRSCYRSKWRFNANRPDDLQPGRFFFVPDGTPALPFPHPFGSGIWVDGNPDEAPDVGEVYGIPRQWDNGRMDLPDLPAIPLGQASDYLPGSIPPETFPPSELRAGIPSVCWTNQGISLVPIDQAFDVNNLSVRLAYSQIQTFLYDSEFSKIEDFFTEWLGPGAVSHFYPLEGLLPAMVIVTTANFVLVHISGTDTAQQLATQAFQGGLPPRPQGNVRTIPLWANTAQTVADRIRDVGVTDQRPILIAGHSYGAAVSSVLATRVRIANPDRRVALITWGLPAPGDREMQRVLETVPSWHHLNFGDLVTAVPINLRPGWQFSALAGVDRVLNWGEWTHAPLFQRFREDGSWDFGPEQSLPYNVLLPMVQRVVLGQPWAFNAEHAMTEYTRRMGITGAGGAWPFTLASWEILFGPGSWGIGGIASGDGDVVESDVGGIGVIEIGNVSEIVPVADGDGIEFVGADDGNGSFVFREGGIESGTGI